MTVVATFLDGIEAERVAWIWPGRLAKGKVTLHVGDPGLGKSTVAADLMARMSRGGFLPLSHTQLPEMKIGIMADEDGLKDTIIPRLEIAGALMSNIAQLTGTTKAGHKRSLMLPDDIDEIITATRELELDFLYIDPLAAHAGASVNLHINQDVRSKIMSPLATLGEETKVTVLICSHPNKAIGGPAMYRSSASIGIIGAARFGLVFGKDPDDADHLVIAPIKTNVGPMPPSIGYRLESVDGTDHACVVWDTGPCGLSADELLAAATPNPADKAKTGTEHWLLAKLANGPRLAKELEDEAGKENHGWRTVQRAKKTLQVRSDRSGFGAGGEVYWLLPGQELPEDAPDVEANGHHRTPQPTVISRGVLCAL